MQAVTSAYKRWAPVYDLAFGKVFSRARSAAILAADRIGGRVLEVGVGTGISLPQYSPNTKLYGVDISEPMLAKAHKRVTEFGLHNVEGLAVMDAEHLEFPDGSFDVVVAQYVVTTVPNPEATLDEFARVLKPGGEIILLSRIGAEVRGAQEHRAPRAAGRNQAAWLAHGVSVRPLHALGGAQRHGAPRRAPPDAAARALLPDPLHQGGPEGSRAKRRSLSAFAPLSHGGDRIAIRQHQIVKQGHEHARRS